MPPLLLATGAPPDALVGGAEPVLVWAATDEAAARAATPIAIPAVQAHSLPLVVIGVLPLSRLAIFAGPLCPEGIIPFT
jgi:hypothetical protein